MKLQLQYRTDNAFDTVVLVDAATELVRSDWTVTRDVMNDFCDCSQDAGDWDDRFGDEHKADDYGALVAVRSEYALEAVKPETWAERVKHFMH